MFCCLSVPHLRAIPQLIWFPCHLTELNWFQIFFPQLSCLVILALVLTTLSFLVWKLSHCIRSEVLFQNHHPENRSVLLIVSSVYEIHQWFCPPAVRLVEISRFDITYSSQAQSTWTKQQTANSKSLGPNSIPMKALKCLSPLISSPFSQIINKSFQSGIFPEKMKLAKVIPLFKKGCLLTASNYRPISLLSVFSKITEKSCMNVSISS